VRIQGAHPDWLGYRDRHYFPPSTESPTLFIRKLKITGSVFEEGKLLHWIKENQEKTTCDLERASGDSWCLGSLLRNQTKSKQVILIPVNQGFLEIAQNLECSLSQLNLTKNIVYWSLDIHTHEYFLRKNKISVFLPGGVEVDGLHGKQSHPLQAMMKQKPRIIQYILDSGFGVWFLDADTVVFKNITETIEDGVDVYLGLANLDYISDMGYNPSASIMYFENSLGSRHVLDVWKKAIASSVRLDDSVALKKALKQFVVMDPRTNVLINETPVVKYLDGELFLTLQEESLLKDPYLVHLGKHQVDDFKAKKLWFMGPPCQPIKVPQ
jgi:hypothetical protein